MAVAGDHCPITAVGRVTGVCVLLAGVGIVGTLAGILAGVLIPAPKKQADPTAEIGELREEQLPDGRRRDLTVGSSDGLAVIP